MPYFHRNASFGLSDKDLDQAVHELSTRAVTVNFAYSHDEFVRAYRRRPMLLQSRVKIVLICPAFFIFGAIWIAILNHTIMTRNDWLLIIAFELLGFTILAAIAYQVVITKPERYWRDLSAHNPFSINFSYEGFAAQPDGKDWSQADDRTSWKEMKSVYHIHEGYIFQPKDEQEEYLFIPKSAFADKNDELSFRRLADQNTKVHWHQKASAT